MVSLIEIKLRGLYLSESIRRSVSPSPSLFTKVVELLLKGGDTLLRSPSPSLCTKVVYSLLNGGDPASNAVPRNGVEPLRPLRVTGF